MSEFAKKNIIYSVIRSAPLIILFISVLNEFDLNYLEIFSLNLGLTNGKGPGGVLF